MMRPRKERNIIYIDMGIFNMKNKYKVKNKRLSKYLYSLGFNSENIIENTIEYWLFENSNELKEALEFYFYMRNKTR